MPLKFRLRGLAETFVEVVKCPGCGHQGSEDEEEDFNTEFSKVTLSGIIAVIQCKMCSHIFVPNNQKLGIINHNKLRTAVENDSDNTGVPILNGIEDVSLEVEKMNAEFDDKLH